MTYTSDTKCTNCGYTGPVEIPEGLKIFEFPCPECKSKSLVLAPKERIEPIKETPEEK